MKDENTDELIGPPEETNRQPSLPSLGGIVLLCLVLAAAFIAAALIFRFGQGNAEERATQQGESVDLGPADTVSLTPVQEFGPPVIAVGQAVDPLGDNAENDDLAGNAIDGDPSTAWKTETYRRPGFSDVKPGVGYLVTLEGPSVLTRMTITSPTVGWSASVFVGDSPRPEPDDWTNGPYVLERIEGNGVVNFDGVTGSHVLVWITFEGQTQTLLDDGSSALQNRFELIDLLVE